MGLNVLRNTQTGVRSGRDDLSDADDASFGLGFLPSCDFTSGYCGPREQIRRGLAVL